MTRMYERIQALKGLKVDCSVIDGLGISIRNINRDIEALKADKRAVQARLRQIVRAMEKIHQPNS